MPLLSFTLGPPAGLAMMIWKGMDYDHDYDESVTSVLSHK